jgi:hypothetical protein
MTNAECLLANDEARMTNDELSPNGRNDEVATPDLPSAFGILSFLRH